MLVGKIETYEIIFVESPGLICYCWFDRYESHCHYAVSNVGVHAEIEAFFTLDVFLFEENRCAVESCKTIQCDMCKIIECARTVIHGCMIHEVFTMLYGIESYGVNTGRA
jgi:hypothetical protein